MFKAILIKIFYVASLTYILFFASWGISELYSNLIKTKTFNGNFYSERGPNNYIDPKILNENNLVNAEKSPIEKFKSSDTIQYFQIFFLPLTLIMIFIFGLKLKNQKIVSIINIGYFLLIILAPIASLLIYSSTFIFSNFGKSLSKDEIYKESYASIEKFIQNDDLNNAIVLLNDLYDMKILDQAILISKNKNNSETSEIVKFGYDNTLSEFSTNEIISLKSPMVNYELKLKKTNLLSSMYEFFNLSREKIVFRNRIFFYKYPEPTELGFYNKKIDEGRIFKEIKIKSIEPAILFGFYSRKDDLLAKKFNLSDSFAISEKLKEQSNIPSYPNLLREKRLFYNLVILYIIVLFGFLAWVFGSSFGESELAAIFLSLIIFSISLFSALGLVSYESFYFYFISRNPNIF